MRPMRAFVAEGRALRLLGAGAAWSLRHRPSGSFRPGTTVVTVNWNSLPFLQPMLDATRAMSPGDTEIMVVDNGSSDGSVEYLRRRGDVRVLPLPVNFGHGVALDIGAALVRTEHLAVLDIDAFPVSDRWLSESIAALDAGVWVAGAHMHRNFIHPLPRDANRAPARTRPHVPSGRFARPPAEPSAAVPRCRRGALPAPHHQVRRLPGAPPVRDHLAARAQHGRRRLRRSRLPQHVRNPRERQGPGRGVLARGPRRAPP